MQRLFSARQFNQYSPFRSLRLFSTSADDERLKELIRSVLRESEFAPNRTITNEKLLAQIKINQEEIKQNRREDSIRGFVDLLEECTSFHRAMETSRRAMVYCKIPDEIACKTLRFIEYDNHPVFFRGAAPLVALGLVTIMPISIIWATYDPEGFFPTFCNAIQKLTGVDPRVNTWDTMEPLGFAAMSLVAIFATGTLGDHVRKLGVRPLGFRFEQLQINRVIAYLDELNVDENGNKVEKLPVELREAIAYAVIRLDTVIYRWIPNDEGVSVRIFPWGDNHARVKIDATTPKGIRGLYVVYSNYLKGKNTVASKKNVLY